ncbi:MAG: hypothetical protein PSV13_04910 [Lacunisphaera sp.]|nr:hypothetical protein [Lacunisphaera sp.]
MNAPAHHPSAFPWQRLLALMLALFSLGIAWAGMTAISRDDPWYRNTDMNMHNMVDALAINSNISPNPFAQPAVPLKYLLALDYRVRHQLGILPVWNMETFGDSADPLREIPRLIRIERMHSRVLVIALILAAAALTYAVARDLAATGLGIILLCGSAGLLFQGLLARPELLCVGFGNVLALGCTWRATITPRWPAKHAWLFLAGFLGGVASLEKVPGVCYVALCYGWCWLAAWIARRENPAAGPAVQPDFWSGLLPAAAGISMLWLLFRLDSFHDDLGPVVLGRLRFAAIVITVLPLLAQGAARHRRGAFFAERMRELALLGGGALAALPLSYLLLRGVMSEQPASRYMTGVLHFLANPAPYVEGFLGGKETTRLALLSSLKDAPFLFGGAVLLSGWVCQLRGVPLRLKGFMGLLLGGALGLTYLMSKRHFSHQYSVFPQVPLLLVWTLGLHAVLLWWRARRPGPGMPWPALLVLLASFAIMLTAQRRVQSRYYFYQDDVGLPVNHLTLTFLFDHDAHAAAYLKLMKDRYGDRENFAKELDRYLSDPAHRD